MPSYTFIEPPVEEHVRIHLATEEGRVSEQTFNVLLKLSIVNSSSIYQPAVLNEDFVAQKATGILFQPFTQRNSYHFILLPDNDTTPGETETFYVIASNVFDDRFPTYFPAEVYYSKTAIVIIEHDAESK